VCPADAEVRRGYPNPTPAAQVVADAFDNALMETVNGLFKTECIRTTMFHAGPFRSIADVEWATVRWVDWWNNRRLHSSLAYLAPEEFEHAHYATLNHKLQPVQEPQETPGASDSVSNPSGCALNSRFCTEKFPPLRYRLLNEPSHRRFGPG